mmetsp:Transcript_34553/g.55195  ORF Transcript_34553/g.55195 Transcript_34553/m.55195 type:complete len:146 (-) Transcript_34553:101-538(-)
MKLYQSLVLLLAALVCSTNAEYADDDGQDMNPVLLTYETTVEHFRGDKLVNVYSLTETEEVDPAMVDEDLLDEDSEFHLYITFTRYSDSFLTISIVICILALLSFVFTDRSSDEESDEEQPEDIVDVEGGAYDLNDLSKPLVTKA